MLTGSLRFRLLAAAALCITIALLPTGLILMRMFEQQVRDQVTFSLQKDLMQLTGAIEIAAAGNLQVNPPLSDIRYLTPYGMDTADHRYWQVQVKGTLPGDADPPILRSPSLWDFKLHPHVPKGPEQESLIVVKHDVKLMHGDKPVMVTVLVATSEAEMMRPLSELRNKLFMAIAIVGAVLIAGTWVQVAVGLRPFKRLRMQLAAIRHGSAQRLWGGFPAEVAPLVVEFNDVLDMRDASLERARRRAGDLAHGLKTPLTVLSAVARQLRKAGHVTEAGDIDEQVETMVHHIEQTLVRARLASGKGHAASDLLSAVHRVSVAVKRLPGAEDLTFNILVPPNATVPIEQHDLTELIGNLMDNARKWATSKVRVAYDAPLLTVEDDGPGVPRTELSHIGERGRRLDESKQGSGLGLSIVEDIADIYGLAVHYDRSDLGGFKVEIRV